MGGVTGDCVIELILVTSTIHSRTSGLIAPGVGYRTVRVSGNDVLPKLCTAITAFESNQGYTIVPTWVSLNCTNIICDPSSELQIASGVVKISSVCEKVDGGDHGAHVSKINTEKRNEKMLERKHFCQMEDNAVLTKWHNLYRF